MRLSLFVFVAGLILAVSVSAQNSLTVRAFEQGTQAAQAKEYKTALEKYRRALLFSETENRSADLHARIHFNIGVCLFNLKQTADAADEFAEAIKLSRRTYQKAFYALGMAESELKRWQAAERAFRDSIELKRDDGEAWFDLGLVLIETKNYETAEMAFQQAIKYKSVAAADAHNNLGVIFALRTNFPAAEKEFKTALIQSNNESIEARNNLQFCRLHKHAFNQNVLAKFEFSRKNKQGE